MRLRTIIYTAFLGLGISAFTACEDDITEDLRSEATIEPYGFTVVSAEFTDENGVKHAPKTFKVKPDETGNVFNIRISPFLNAEDYLSNATPKFCLSMGATVTPPMTEPQNFADPDNPVVYTVTSGDGKRVERYTIGWTESELKPAGEGMGDGEQIIYKTYVELGFPGTYASWPQNDNLGTSYGDLMGFPAFCGKDKIVVFSRRFAWGDDGAAGSKYAMAANPAHAFKVFDVNTLSPAGSLNLGNIAPADVVAITSDWLGNMVASVGRKASGKTDFYYWSSPEDAPTHIGTADVTTDISANSTDAGCYINVAGDITSNAVIATSAPRTDKGQHYKFNVYRGVLEPEFTVINTGHSELDKNQFQMISYFGTMANDPYLVGDCSANGSEDNGQIHIYLNNPDGSNRGEADYHMIGFNGGMHDDGEQWWSRSGKWLSRNGGRRPTVHAMVLNGMPYSYATTGTDWRNRGILFDQGLTKVLDGYPSFGFGNCTKEKNPQKAEGGIWLGDCFGCMADWYFDDETQEGYVAVWSDRFGMNMFKITCYE